MLSMCSFSFTILLALNMFCNINNLTVISMGGAFSLRPARITHYVSELLNKTLFFTEAEQVRKVHSLVSYMCIQVFIGKREGLLKLCMQKIFLCI